MRKKAKYLVGALSLLIALGLFLMPGMVQSSIPSVYYVTPTSKIYENQVSCTGTVQSALVQVVYLDSTIVADEVYVEVGDRVRQGDPLLCLDEQRTAALGASPFNSLELLQGLIAENSLQPGGVDWFSLAASYDLSASVSGENELQLYRRELENLLSESGLLSTAADAVGVFASNPVDGTVTAPISGIITDVAVRRQIPVSSGSALVTVTDDTQYKVIASVSESDISMVTVGDNAVIRGVGFGGSTFHGEVIKISPVARKTLSGTTTETVVDVEIKILNPNARLKPGLTAKVEITGGDDYELLTVPYEAIRQDEYNDEYVYVYEEGKLKKQLVTTGREMTTEVQILSGLTQESIVVYNPSDLIKEGAMIHIRGRADVD